MTRLCIRLLIIAGMSLTGVFSQTPVQTEEAILFGSDAVSVSALGIAVDISGNTLTLPWAI